MTNEDKMKIHAALAASFAENAIQRTDGRVTGRGYDTTGIGYQFICNRLNEVLGVGGWRAHRTVTVKEVTTAKGRPAFEAICDLPLELGSWENGDFVVFAESLSYGGHTAMSEADARKGAYTNALKKAAAMFGCGRQAYEGMLDDDNVPGEHDGATPSSPVAIQRPTATSMPPAQAAGVQQSPQVARPSLGLARNRLTSKQLAAIWAIGRRLGMDQQGLRAVSKQRFNKQPEFLTRDEASALISAMSQQAGNGHTEDRDPGAEGRHALVQGARRALHLRQPGEGVSQVPGVLLFKYVRREDPAFVPVNLAFGTAIHAALAAYYQELKHTREPLRRDLLLEVFRDAWTKAEDGPIPLQPDDEDDGNLDQLTDKGVSMLNAFHEHAGRTAAGQDVVAVEKYFAAPIHDVETGELLEEQLVGTIDLIVNDGDAERAHELSRVAVVCTPNLVARVRCHALVSARPARSPPEAWWSSLETSWPSTRSASVIISRVSLSSSMMTTRSRVDRSSSHGRVGRRTDAIHRRGTRVRPHVRACRAAGETVGSLRVEEPRPCARAGSWPVREVQP